MRAIVSNERGGVPGPRQYYEEAAAWLREKEIEDDQRATKAEKRAQTMLYISLAILVLTILGLKVAAFGML